MTGVNGLKQLPLKLHEEMKKRYENKPKNLKIVLIMKLIVKNFSMKMISVMLMILMMMIPTMMILIVTNI